MPIISTVEEQDFERLFEIEQAAHSVPWTMGILKNNQGERYLNLKLTENNQIIGFAVCQTVLDEATLFNIAIAPDFQSKGFGTLLLTVLIDNLRARNINTLWLEVRESNPARRLYESMGFNEVDMRKDYYPTQNGGRENARVMALYL